ncbi:nucleotidyltransferase family protein [Bradyrhizobium sp. Arg314]
MSRNEVIERLQKNADAIRGMGATSLYLFGSASRGDVRSDSDLDLFIDYDPARRFSLIDLVGIKQFLEEKMSAEIDITTRDSLHPMLKADIGGATTRPITCRCSF